MGVAYHPPPPPIKISKKILGPLEELCLKIKLPTVEVRGIMEITNTSPNGIESIKKTLLEELNNNSKINITYLGAPKYRLSINSEDFKTAEKTLKPIIENIEKKIIKQKGSFNFQREESKKTRENWYEIPDKKMWKML